MLGRRRSVLSIGLRTVFFAFCYFVASCYAARSHKQCYASASSCGNIRNISYPFRWKTDPHNCGDTRYELSCQNNRAIIYLSSWKFYVEALSYENGTIRILDPGLQKDNCSSMPLYSVMDYYSLYQYGFRLSMEFNAYPMMIFLSCPTPVNFPYYIDTSSSCIINGSAFRKHSYILVGDTVMLMNAPDSCTIDATVPTRLKDMGNYSFADIHRELLMGVELFWLYDLSNFGFCLARSFAKLIAALLYPNTIFFNWKSFFFNFIPFCMGDCKNIFQSFNCASSYIVSIFLSGLFWIGIIIGAAKPLFGYPCLFAYLIYKIRRRHLSMDITIEEFLQSQSNLTPIRYSYSDIKKMSKGFKHKLGQGGYGSVFKGKLRSGILVAIKMLANTKGKGQDFINEVATIGRIHHVNIVRLIGYCSDRSKRALVYEFMPNGSLEKYIFPNKETISLNWEKMYEISLGIARGIEYIHRGCEMQILHFDIKPQNILLDKNFTPKLSDFGLAKLYPTGDSMVSLTAARGTMGYIAPELFYKNIGGISNKADVYSFGMLLMEMVGRRKNINAFAEHSSQIYFPSWIYDHLNQGYEMEMGDCSEDDKKIAKKMIIVALWCIQMKPVDRPPMGKIIEMLEGPIELVQMPPKPFLSSSERLVVDDHATETNATPLSTIYEITTI